MFIFMLKNYKVLKVNENDQIKRWSESLMIIKITFYSLSRVCVGVHVSSFSLIAFLRLDYEYKIKKNELLQFFHVTLITSYIFSSIVVQFEIIRNKNVNN